MLEFFPFAVAIVALIVAIRAFNQTSALRERVYALERAADRPRSAGRAAADPYRCAASHRRAGEPSSSRRSAADCAGGRAASAVGHAAADLGQRRPRRCRKLSPASRSASVPAGWSGSAV